MSIRLSGDQGIATRAEENLEKWKKMKHSKTGIGAFFDRLLSV